jgi:hypothetical protein
MFQIHRNSSTTPVNDGISLAADDADYADTSDQRQPGGEAAGDDP